MGGDILAPDETKKIERDEKIFPAIRVEERVGDKIEEVLLEATNIGIDGSNGALQIVYRNGFVSERAGTVMEVNKPRGRDYLSDQLGYVLGH